MDGNGFVDGRMDLWIAGWMHGWMAGCMLRFVDASVPCFGSLMRRRNGYLQIKTRMKGRLEG